MSNTELEDRIKIQHPPKHMEAVIAEYTSVDAEIRQLNNLYN